MGQSGTKRDALGLTPRQIRTLGFVFSEKNVESGLLRAKVSKTTFYRWLQESEDFRVEYEKQKKDLVNTAFDTLQANLRRAVDVFVGLLGSQNEGIRHQTAVKIIDHVIKLRDLSELEDRLEKLEETIGSNSLTKIRR